MPSPREELVCPVNRVSFCPGHLAVPVQLAQAGKPSDPVPQPEGSPGTCLGLPQRQVLCRASKLRLLPGCAPKAEPFACVFTALGSGLPFSVKAGWGQVLTRPTGVSLKKAQGTDRRRDQPCTLKGLTWLKARCHSSPGSHKLPILFLSLLGR